MKMLSMLKQHVRPDHRRKTLSMAISIAVIGCTMVSTLHANDQSTDQNAPSQTTNSTKTSKDKVLQLNGVSVTANVQQTVPPKATYTQSVTDEETLRNLSPGPTVTVQTMLNQQPSVFGYANGPNGVETTIYLRAFNSSQFSETFDGVALNDVFNGGVTNQAENRNNVLLIPGNLQSVQIYRGINNPAVNSYNSLGGTIDFIPRQPEDSMSGDVGASYGSFKSYDYHATFNTGDWNGIKQVFSFEHSGSRGWIDNTGDHNNNLYWGLTYNIDDNNQLANYLLYNDNKGFSPFNMPVPLMQQYGRNYQWPLDWTNSPIKDSNWMDIVDWKSAFTDDVQFRNKLFFGGNQYLRTSFSNPIYQQSATQPYNLEDDPSSYAYWLSNPNGPTYDPAAQFGSVENGTDYHFYGYTTTGIGDSPSLTIHLPQNDIVVGGNATYGDLHSREYWYGESPMPKIDGYNDAWDEHDRRLLASLYAQDTISLFDDSLRLTPGIKYIYASTTDRDTVGFYYPIAGEVHDTEHFWSPTFGVNYQIVDGLNAYASYGKNFKLPDISAYYGAFQTDGNGNNTIVPPKVKPEFVRDYEIGLRYRLGGFSVMVNGYRENFTNTFITATDPVSLLSTFENGGSSRYQGAELQLQNDFGQTAVGDLSTYFNYAHNQAKFTSSFNSDYAGQVSAGQPLAGVPQNLLSAGVVWKWQGWRVNLEGRFVDKQYIDQLYAGTPTASTIKPYTVVNIGISDTVRFAESGFGQQVRFGLNVDNLLDREYFNTAYTDTDYYGNNFIRAVIAAPRSITGSVDIFF
ncbi:TonB-dependent receptor [Dyella psychrodurans]|uniref:TonB-dependent receptor n=1 Tax=Dyella psychrodurans TaxID=1927960 RepID=A0A370WVD5_9GAMM|nr:TonB-dependent receptor [Dyella psychrodurans]RDS80050.1 TonB-dependent receptor [Dyella psychrodurans]